MLKMQQNKTNVGVVQKTCVIWSILRIHLWPWCWHCLFFNNYYYSKMALIISVTSLEMLNYHTRSLEMIVFRGMRGITARIQTIFYDLVRSNLGTVKLNQTKQKTNQNSDQTNGLWLVKTLLTSPFRIQSFSHNCQLSSGTVRNRTSFQILQYFIDRST